MIYDIELNSAAHYPADGVVGLVETAEDAGFGAFWKGESNSTDPIVLLSAVASRTKSIKVIPATLCILAFVTAFGPWGAYSLSLRSQTARLGGMLTAHRRGACVVAVYTKEVADMKAQQATDMGQRRGYPLAFTTERED